MKFSVFLLIEVIRANSSSAYSIRERSTDRDSVVMNDLGNLKPWSNSNGEKYIDSDLVNLVTDRAKLR